MANYIGDGDFQGSGPTGIAWGRSGDWGIAKFGDDTRTSALFYKRSVHNKARSLREGRPIYDDVDYVRIQHPGETKQVIDHPVNEAHMRRWPSQWAAYQQNRKQEVVGTPVDLLFPTSPATADMLKAFNIFTVEQLSELSAEGMAAIGMGAQDYVNYAKRYRDEATRNAGLIQAQQEIDKLKGELRVRDQEHTLAIEALKKQIDDMRSSRVYAAPPPPQAQVQPQQQAAGLPPLQQKFPERRERPKLAG